MPEQHPAPNSEARKRAETAYAALDEVRARNAELAEANERLHSALLATPAPEAAPLSSAPEVSVPSKAAQSPAPEAAREEGLSDGFRWRGLAETLIKATRWDEWKRNGYGWQGDRITELAVALEKWAPESEAVKRFLAPDLPTTVQADRDAGQVRLTEDAVAEVIHKACGDFLTHVGAWRAAQAVTGLLAARQSADAEADVRVEFSVRLGSAMTTPTLNPALPDDLRDHPDAVLVRRTVTTSAWEVAE